MSSELNTRIQHKRGLAADWAKAVNFVPLKAEIIVYLPDETHKTARYKVGDGVTKINDLPFTNEIEGALWQTGNEATNIGTVAFGSNTKAGSKGFTVTAVVDNGDGTGKYTLSSVTGLEVGMPYSVALRTANYNAGTITAIDGNVVAVDGYKHIELNSNTDNVEEYNVYNVFFVVGRPDLGDKEIGFNAQAEGDNTCAHSRASHVEGSNTIGLGQFSHAEGQGTMAGHAAHSEGDSTRALGDSSHAEGFKTEAKGGSSHAEGNGTKALKNYGHAEGYGTTANGLAAHAEGGNTNVTADYAHAEGNGTTASGVTAHAEGGSTTALGRYSHAEGNGVTAEGQASHAEGANNTAKGNYSHAEGNNNTAEGESAHAEGNGTLAKGVNAHAEGSESQANGNNSHAEGKTTVASGYGAHAEGGETVASDSYAHAEGYKSKAESNSAHAEGYATQATDVGAHSEGYYSKATNRYSHAEGNNTEAIGQSSHAEGEFTKAEGHYSHAGGTYSEARGVRSFVHGFDVIAQAENSFAIGQHGEVNENAIFSVGAGNDSQSRKNALEVGFDGNVYAKQKIYVGGAGATKVSAKEVATKEDVDSAKSAVKNELLNGAGEAYDTLKELGDLINENTDALGALERIATNKADGNHIHDNYMTNNNPTGNGAFSLNRKEDSPIGTNSVAVGSNTIAGGKAFKIESVLTKDNLGFYSEFFNLNDDECAYIVSIFDNLKTVPEWWTTFESLVKETSTKLSYSVVMHTAKYNCGSIIDAKTVKNIFDTSLCIIVNNYTPLEFNSNIDDPENFNVYNFLLIDDHPEMGNINVGFNAYAEGDNTYASNNAAHAEGRNTKAIGKFAHAEGNNTIAAHAAHAEGQQTKALGDVSHVEGYINNAYGNASHVEGSMNNAYGNYSHVEGKDNISIGQTGHAEGWFNKSGGKFFTITAIHPLNDDNTITADENGWYQLTLDSVEGLEIEMPFSVKIDNNFDYLGTIKAIDIYTNIVKIDAYIHKDFYTVDPLSVLCSLWIPGRPDLGTTTIEYPAHSEGYLTVAQNIATHAEGYNTQATGRYSHAEGANTKAGYGAHAEGHTTLAVGVNSHAEGQQTVAKGSTAHAEGYKTNALGNHAHSEGYNTQANGADSHAEGNTTIANGANSHSEGQNNYARGIASHVEGAYNEANGNRSHAEGIYTKATGENAHAEGGALRNSDGTPKVYTVASGGDSHAEGRGTTASAAGAHSEGQETTASALSAHAEGYKTTASGLQGHAEGFQTVASGNQSHAEGTSCKSVGQNSHAGGSNSISNGVGSFAHGNSVIADSEYQTVFGKFNERKNDKIFIIGNGSSNDTRKNALEIDNNGNTIIQGKIYSENSKELVTVEQLPDVSALDSIEAKVEILEEASEGVFYTEINDSQQSYLKTIPNDVISYARISNLSNIQKIRSLKTSNLINTSRLFKDGINDNNREWFDPNYDYEMGSGFSASIAALFDGQLVVTMNLPGVGPSQNPISFNTITFTGELPILPPGTYIAGQDKSRLIDQDGQPTGFTAKFAYRAYGLNGNYITDLVGSPVTINEPFMLKNCYVNIRGSVTSDTLGYESYGIVIPTNVTFGSTAAPYTEFEQLDSIESPSGEEVYIKVNEGGVLLFEAEDYDAETTSIITYKIKNTSSLATINDINQAKQDIKDEILNGASATYDTLKELGDLINENTTAIDNIKYTKRYMFNQSASSDLTLPELPDDILVIMSSIETCALSPHEDMGVDGLLITTGSSISCDNKSMQVPSSITSLPNYGYGTGAYNNIVDFENNKYIQNCNVIIPEVAHEYGAGAFFVDLSIEVPQEEEERYSNAMSSLKCSHSELSFYYTNVMYDYGFALGHMTVELNGKYTTEAELQAFIDEQRANGTPVTICYGIPDPIVMDIPKTKIKLPAHSGSTISFDKASGLVAILTPQEFATKEELEQAKSDVKNELLNGAGEAYDTLKELGDLINENTDALSALEQLAVNKADKVYVDNAIAQAQSSVIQIKTWEVDD